jgi:hypothetical protein
MMYTLTKQQKKAVLRQLAKDGPEAICAAYGNDPEMREIAYRHHRDPDRFLVAVSAWEANQAAKIK